MPEIKCPTCQKLAEYSPSNPFRPFCCERCKLIDLGEWASGERHLPGATLTETDLADIDNIEELSALLNGDHSPTRH